MLFKTLQVVRFFDKQRNVLVYVAYSDRVIEGSPKEQHQQRSDHELAGTIDAGGRGEVDQPSS